MGKEKNRVVFHLIQIQNTISTHLYMKPLGFGSLLSLMAYCVMPIMVLFGGCKTDYQKFKQEADTQVYDIIDEKWDSVYGAKVNYQVEDTAGDPNRLALNSALPPHGIMSLGDAIEIATNSNRSYQKEKESLYNSVLNLTTERHAFDLIYNVTGGGNYVSLVENNGITLETASGDGKIQFTKLLKDGAQLSFDFSTTWLNTLISNSDSSVGASLFASFRQPLLKGYGRKIVMENLMQSERDVIYKLRGFAQYRKGFVVTVVAFYYNVLSASDGVENAKNNLKQIRFSTSRTSMMADAGRLPTVELDQARQNELTAENGLNRALKSYEESLDNFKVFLSYAPDAQFLLDPNELVVLKGVGVMPPELELDAALVLGLSNRLDLKTELNRVEDRFRQMGIVEDAFKVSLDLVGSMGIDNGDNDRITLNLNDKTTYALGLDIDLNLDKLNERNNYRKALIAKEDQMRVFAQKYSEVTLEIRTSYRDLVESSKRYEIEKNSLQLAQSRVASTEMLLLAGRAITRDLLESQDALLTAQNGVTAALIEHTIAKLSFYKNIELLQVKPDGMWELLNDK